MTNHNVGIISRRLHDCSIIKVICGESQFKKKIFSRTIN